MDVAAISVQRASLVGEGAMSKPIWFPFYVNDFLSSSKVALLTTEEIGAYILLLCHAWQDPHCSLPDDNACLAKLGRIRGDVTNIRACFRVKKDRLINDRLYQEWQNVKEKSELAKRSIAVRWEKKRNTFVLRTKYSSQSHSQSHSELEKEKNKTGEFDVFWNAYPKKIGKKDALKAWEKAKDKPALADILRSIASFKSTEQWTKDNGQFIPNPSTWLNQGRWADEPMKGLPNGQAKIPPFPGPDDPIGRGQWRRAYGDPANPKVVGT